MTVTKDDFDKIWASQSPLTPYSFSESQYKQGWNFVGATPPSRQMWDFLQKQNDEKAQWLYLNVVQGIPIGVVQAFAGSTTPQGWLLCDGSAVSRTTYANLFACIGTTYGAGNGSTTFNLPNLTDRFIQGNSTVGTVKSAGLPNITGDFITQAQALDGNTETHGAFSWQKLLWSVIGTSASDLGGRISFNASSSNSIYGNSNTVQPPSVTMRYIIKY